ncbi:hypothetical protein UM760_10170 [Staphylococcus aureus]|nr:hypothetical protein UM760_10170 [Staphylococcus aureus]
MSNLNQFDKFVPHLLALKITIICFHFQNIETVIVNEKLTFMDTRRLYGLRWSEPIPDEI